jgi:predicted nuclease of restriction endonuclease-like (RecB) superfamily
MTCSKRACESIQRPPDGAVARRLGEPVSCAGRAPSGYIPFLNELKARIRTARVKAALSANRELIELYWYVGKGIVKRQRTEGWGKSVVERLSQDLRSEFLGMTGFSPQNIWYMRAFYLAWTEDIRILQQPAGELEGQNLPSILTKIPWFHNVVLIEKLKNPIERMWYAKNALEHGWSRNVLVHQIEIGLYMRQGKAVTNFERSLPYPQSDLAQEAIKDPYIFDFLSMKDKRAEQDLERGLVDNIRKFLLELGVGFAFVGSQYHLEVEGEDFYIDLLFYHLRLRCFVVIDLKAGPFKPEYAGKMNFYLSAVDDGLRYDTDNPSIGIILCKTKKRLIAEYALRDMTAPIGVSEYRLTRTVPADLLRGLPGVEDLEKGLKGVNG